MSIGIIATISVIASLVVINAASAATVNLGRRTAYVNAGTAQEFCSAQGQLIDNENLRGRGACVEVRNVKRVRSYYILLKVWRGSWVNAALSSEDIVTAGNFERYTQQRELCTVNTTARRWYQVQHAVAVRSNADVVRNQTILSYKFQAPLLSNDPLCVPPPGPSPTADIALAFSHNPPSPLNGEAFTLVAAAGNSGGATANGVAFVANLPDDWSGVAADVVGGTCDVSLTGNVVTCNLGSLSPGEVDLISIHVANAHGTGPVSLTGTLTSTTLGVADATTTESFTIQPGANLTLNKSATSSTDIAATTTVEEVIPGSAVDYTFDVSNSGPNNAADVVVTDDWPTPLGTVTVLAGGDATCFLNASDHLVCQFGTIANGGTESVTVHTIVDVTTAPDQDITNNAVVTSSTADRGLGDVTDSATIHTIS